jgi:hypothetical protein
MRPSIDQTVFPNTPVDGYWTSSDGHGNAWQVQFFNGVAQIGDLFNPDRVRCVR